MSNEFLNPGLMQVMHEREVEAVRQQYQGSMQQLQAQVEQLQARYEGGMLDLQQQLEQTRLGLQEVRGRQGSGGGGGQLEQTRLGLQEVRDRQGGGWGEGQGARRGRESVDWFG